MNYINRKDNGSYISNNHIIPKKGLIYVFETKEEALAFCEGTEWKLEEGYNYWKVFT